MLAISKPEKSMIPCAVRKAQVFAAATALVSSISSTFAETLPPRYAVHDYELRAGPVPVRVVNVGVVPNGDSTDCERLLRQFQRGQDKYPANAVTATRSSTCSTVLPQHLVGIEVDRPIADAFVTKVQPIGTGAVYTVWYGIDPSNSSDTCDRLMNQMRSRMDPKILLSVHLSCMPPT